MGTCSDMPRAIAATAMVPVVGSTHIQSTQGGRQTCVLTASFRAPPQGNPPMRGRASVRTGRCSAKALGTPGKDSRDVGRVSVELCGADCGSVECGFLAPSAAIQTQWAVPAREGERVHANPCHVMVGDAPWPSAARFGELFRAVKVGGIPVADCENGTKMGA